MSPSKNIYIYDVRPISDSVATCRSQPMKNDHVTTMEPPRGESSLSRERKTRQLVRCEWTINIGSRQTTSIEGNSRDGEKVVRDTSFVWQENAQFLSCNIHRPLLLPSRSGGNDRWWCSSLLVHVRHIAYVYIHVYMYFASLFELFEYPRYVDSFRGSCRVARLEIVWSNVASSDAYDTSTNGKVY